MEENQQLPYHQTGFSSDKKKRISTFEAHKDTERSSEASPSPHIFLTSNNIAEAEEFLSRSARLEQLVRLRQELH